MKENVDILKKGTAIITAKPFSFVLNSKQRTIRCDNCLKRYIMFTKNLGFNNFANIVINCS